MSSDAKKVPKRADLVSASRRRLLFAGTSLALGSLISVTEPGHAGESEAQRKIRLTLPRPTGEYAIGTVALHLIDRARQDPYWSTPHSRELMVSIWYPARARGQGNRVPWMPAEALGWFRPELADFFLQAVRPPQVPPPGNPPPGSSPPNVALLAQLPEGSDPSLLDDVRFPVTHARHGAPPLAIERPHHDDSNGVAGAARRHPVVLFSPGYGINREQGTALVEDLASHGYVVVTISHTYESAEVQFPRGRVELGRPDLDMSPHLAVTLRRDDVKFVLDELREIAAGRKLDASGRPLIRGLGDMLDLTRVGMFGHSLGGATAVQAMAHDRRVVAGIDLDGTVFPDIDPMNTPPPQLEAAMTQLAASISDRPFMFMTSGGADPQRFFGPFVRSFWDNLSGWRRFLSLSRSSHYSYTDNELLLQQCIAAGIVPDFPPGVELIDATRAVEVQRAYVRAFFDRWLRGRNGGLLDGPSTRFPEIAFH